MNEPSTVRLQHMHTGPSTQHKKNSATSTQNTHKEQHAPPRSTDMRAALLPLPALGGLFVLSPDLGRLPPIVNMVGAEDLSPVGLRVGPADRARTCVHKKRSVCVCE